MKILVIEGLHPQGDAEEFEELILLLKDVGYEVRVLPHIPSTWTSIEKDPDLVYDSLLLWYPPSRPDSDRINVELSMHPCPITILDRRHGHIKKHFPEIEIGNIFFSRNNLEARQFFTS